MSVEIHEPCALGTIVLRSSDAGIQAYLEGSSASVFYRCSYRWRDFEDYDALVRQAEAVAACELLQRSDARRHREIEAALIMPMRERLKAKTTARELLAFAPERRRAWQKLGQCAKYYETDFAERRAVKEALEILRQRHIRRSNRGMAEKARRGEPGRFLEMARHLAEQRVAEKEEALLKRIRSGKLGIAPTRKAWKDGTLRRLGKIGEEHPDSDGAVKCLLRVVGRVNLPETTPFFHAHCDFSGRPGKNHKLTGSVVHSVQISAGWRAMLLTMRDFCSYGKRSYAGDYEKRGGVSFRCYLILRTGGGSAQVHRVLPRFGNEETRFYRGFRNDEERVCAAVAWCIQERIKQEAASLGT
jgi:hypothetical protein